VIIFFAVDYHLHAHFYITCQQIEVVLFFFLGVFSEMKPDLSRNFFKSAAAENYPASRN